MNKQYEKKTKNHSLDAVIFSRAVSGFLTHFRPGDKGYILDEKVVLFGRADAEGGYIDEA